MKLDRTLKKFLRFGLVGFGALTVMSSVVNIVAAWQLIEAAEEQSLGITRNEFVVTYGVMLVIGVALIIAGLRVKS